MKKKIDKRFPEYLVQNWEACDGVNFAIALARITNWILHVEWWTYKDGSESENEMKPLRVYVGNNSNHIYDFRGKQTINSFSNNIIQPLIKKRRINSSGGVATKCYSEEELLNLPLRIKPSETRILEAQKFINENLSFLNDIPKRVEPKVPAHIGARYTFGLCNPFAEALKNLKGYKAIGIIAKEYTLQFSRSKLGYAHSIALDDDGNAIDIWGIDKIENIVQRFGIKEYELDESEHSRVNLTLKQNSPENYKKYYEESVSIINEFF